MFRTLTFGIILIVLVSGCGQAVTFITPTALPSAFTISVPSGNPPKLDGTILPGEWDTAWSEKFSDGSELLLMESGEYLYLAIRANISDILISSVFVDRGDGIKILHSSGGFGTAVYERVETGWQPTRNFSFTERNTSNSEAAQQQRMQFLEEEGWLASLSKMGRPEEMEFQLAMPRGSLRMAVAFLLPPNYDKAAWWPVGLDDASRNIDLLRGDTPILLHFSLEQWVMVMVAIVSANGSPVSSR